jgi:hypothetical protein
MHTYHGHLENLPHWKKQSALAKTPQVERVYQIEKLSPGDARPLVIAMTSKTSAQQLIAALYEQHTRDQIRVSVFAHPVLPGLER